MSHALPILPYSYDALTPVISAEIMELHHGKHHQAYVDKLNAALEAYEEFREKSIEELLGNLDSLPQDIRTVVRNNGGGHYNHSLFWKWLSPEKKEPSPKITAALADKYGSFDAFQEAFTAAAIGVFGSGWVWLLPDLSIEVTPNQDSPIMRGIAPLLGLDVWEHAYYLDYKSARAEYVAAWWNIINWSEVMC
jgi:superoxide dismutase, Fe-Mn family